MLPPELQIPDLKHYPQATERQGEPVAEGLPEQSASPRKLYLREYFKNKSFLFFWVLIFCLSFVVFVFQFFETRKLAETDFVFEKSFFVDSYKYFKDRIWYAIDVGAAELNWDITTLWFLGAVFLLCVYVGVFLFRRRKLISWGKATLFFVTNLVFCVSFFCVFLPATILITVESLVQSQHAQVESYEKVLLTDIEKINDTNIISDMVRDSKDPVEVFDDTSFLFKAKKGKLSFVEAYAIPFALSGLNQKLDEVYKQEQLPYVFFPNKGMLVIDQKKFLTDFGFVFADKYLDQLFGGYKKPTVKTYRVLDGKEYKPFYIQAEIDRLEEYISENQDIYNSNLKVIKDQTARLAEIPGEIAQEDLNYTLYVLDKQEEYAKKCSRDSLLSGCQGLLRAIERDKKIIADNREGIESSRQYAIENIENGKKFNKDIEIYNAETRKTIASLQKGKVEDSIAESQSENAAGNFFTPSTIVIRYFGNDLPMSTKDYVEIVNHEILHYYTDIPKQENVLPSFLNEGLTEYFSTVSFGYTGEEFYTTLSYPLEVRVVELLLKKIPLQDMQKVYFNQDLVLFKFLFKEHFKSVAYEEFELLGGEINKASWLADQYIENYDTAPLLLKIKELLFPDETSIIEEN
jgi:hypothetical protein